jgi:hypothetical protein
MISCHSVRAGCWHSFLNRSPTPYLEPGSRLVGATRPLSGASCNPVTPNLGLWKCPAYARECEGGRSPFRPSLRHPTTGASISRIFELSRASIICLQTLELKKRKADRR